MDQEFLPTGFPSRLVDPLAIVHVNVIPMDTNQVLSDYTVLIKDGMIDAMGPSEGISVEGAEIVDGTGRYLMPGLCDMYCGYSDPDDSIMYLANGVTLIRTSGGTPSQLALERMVERSEFPGPRMITTTPTIDGVGPTGRTDLPPGVPMTSPDEAQGLVQRYSKRGYHQIRVYSLLTKENLGALGKASAGAGLRLVGKCPDRLTFEEAIAAGQTCIDQMHTVARGHLQSGVETPERWDRFGVDVLNLTARHLDFDKIHRLSRLLAGEQVWNTPTLIWHDRISREPSANLADPMLKYMPQSAITGWEAAFGRFAARSSSEIGVWRKAKQGQAQTLPKVVGILHEEGAPLLTGTDSPGPFTIPGFALIQELDKFVGAGMTPYEALRCSTSEPARFLDQSGKWGTIAVGKRADVVMTRSNPLEDIGALRELEAVFINGYLFTREDLDRLLEKRAASVEAPPVTPSTNLSPLNSDGLVVAEGEWAERIGGQDAGKLSYRHLQEHNGDWLIEERYSGMPRRFLERLTTRLTLTPDFKVRHGEYRIESPVGEETCEITWSDTYGYSIRLTEVDGYESVSTLAGEMLIPSERLALTVLPLMLGQGAETDLESLIPMLHVDAAGTTASEMTISALEVDAKEAHWQVKIARSTEAIEQTYRLASDDRFLGMHGPSFRGQRELIPLP